MLLVEFQISTANVENSMQVPQTVRNKTITCAKLLQSSRTLCSAMDYSLSGSFVHGILQARTLECVATHSPRRSSQPGIKPYLLSLLHWQADSLTLVHPESPQNYHMFQQFYFCLKEIKLLSQRDICTIMFIAVLFTIIKMGITYVL